MSLQGFCLVEISLLIFFGRGCSLRALHTQIMRKNATYIHIDSDKTCFAPFRMDQAVKHDIFKEEVRSFSFWDNLPSKDVAQN